LKCGEREICTTECRTYDFAKISTHGPALRPYRVDVHEAQAEHLTRQSGTAVFKQVGDLEKQWEML
jgi:hypothetical protein